MASARAVSSSWALAVRARALCGRPHRGGGRGGGGGRVRCAGAGCSGGGGPPSSQLGHSAPQRPTRGLDDSASGLSPCQRGPLAPSSRGGAATSAPFKSAARCFSNNNAGDFSRSIQRLEAK